MLCVAKVNLSDWPEGHRRDVDPTNERIQGLLRGGYIVGLRIPRSPETAPAAPAPAGEGEETGEAPKAARRPRAKPSKA